MVKTLAFRVDSTQPNVSHTPNAPIEPETETAPPQPSVSFAENPPWGLRAVLLIFVFNFLAFNVIAAAVFVALHALARYRDLSLNSFTQSPLALIPQALSYLFTFFLMVLIVQKGSYDDFWSVLKWRWPHRIPSLLLVGIAMLGFAQLCSLFLPIPKSLPIDRFFRSTHAAWVLAIFGILVAPLYEELLFRGFLYPALRRFLPLTATVLVDGALFAGIHGPQLGWAWAPLLMLLIVGCVLTVVRWKTGSLAAAFLVHSAYNACDFALIFIATDGFRHLERLS